MPHGRCTWALGLGLLLGGLLSGCGSPTAAAGASAASASTVASTNQVDLPPSYVFRPEAIQVAPGTTVTWTNRDNFTHSVQVQGQSEVHVLKPGESTQVLFDQAGTFPYVCTFHTQNMRGTVIVRGT